MTAINFNIQPQHSLEQVDMINATSKLQLEAAEIRKLSNKPNWTSYFKSQLIQQEEYNFITSYELAKTKAERTNILYHDCTITAKCFINLITDVAKDQLIRYVLTLLDDLLQVFNFIFLVLFFKFFFRKIKSVLKYFMNMQEK